MLRKVVRKAAQLLDAARLSAKASSMYGAGYSAVLSRALWLVREGEFLPEEAFRLGLFNPGIPAGELARYLSRKKLTRVQKALNPQSWEPFLKNKAVLYRYCTAVGVPVPRLCAIFFRRTAGWCWDGSIPAGRSDWIELINTKLAAEFVVKPSHGAFGRGLRVFSRRGSQFVDSYANACTAEDIYEAMSSDPDHDSFVIQQRLRNHPELVRLTGVEHLQTARITTVVDANNACRIIQTHLKLVTGSVVTDTFDHGLTGNMQTLISLHDGVLKPAIKMTPDGSGIETVRLHPGTNIPFEGFQMPLWRQTCDLVTEAALKFLPVRTIGWDVAVTPEGPVIVEANFWWDPPNHHRRMDEILDALLQSVL